MSTMNDQVDVDLIDATSLESRLSETPRNREPGETRAERENANDESASIIAWAKEIGGPSATLTLHRYWPERFNGVHTAGHVGTLSEIPEGVFEEFVAREYGGGKYEVKVRQPNAKGVIRVVSSRRITVAGDPKIEVRPVTTIPVGSNVGDQAVVSAMDMMKEMALRTDSRGGIDPELLTAMTQPLKVQVETLLSQLHAKDQIILEKDRVISEKDRQLAEASQRKPDTSGTDGLLGRMLERGDNNIALLQSTFASEKNQLMMSMNEDRKRLEDRADRERRDAIDQGQREIANLRMMYDQQIKIVESGWSSRMDAKDARISDLKREIDRMTGDLDELRRRKDKSLIEVIGEAQKVNEVLGGLSGGNKDEDEGGLMSQLGPIIQAMGQRLTAAPPPPQQLPPPPQRRAPPRQTQAPQQPSQETAEPAVKIPASAIGVEEGHIALAVGALEEALKAGQAPDAFVSANRAFVPPSVIVAIKKVGIDKILDDVAVLDPESPLQTTTGRLFARRVAQMIST